MRKHTKKLITLVLAIVMLTQTALASVYADEVPADQPDAAVETQEGAVEAEPAAETPAPEAPAEDPAPTAEPAAPEAPTEPEAPAEPAAPVVTDTPAASPEEPAVEAPVSEEPAEVPAPAAEPAPNSIVLQPQDTAITLGEWATFTIEVNGAVKSYKWESSKNGGASWSTVKSSSVKPNVLYTKPVLKQDGWLYRCTVTFKNKTKVVSEAAVLTVYDPVAPKQSFEAEEINGVSVYVEAPNGALPAGTQMSVAPVNLDAVQSAVDKAEDISGLVIAAVDITFMDVNGGIIEPKKDITVTMQSEEIATIADPQVVHVDVKADEIETADVAAEVVEQVEEPSAADEVVFEAQDFSTYAVLDNEQEKVYIGQALGNINPPRTRAAGPNPQKRLIENGDGTYTLALSVTGSQSGSTITSLGKANVVLIMDTSSSMNYETGNTYYRYPGTPGDPEDEGRVPPTYYYQVNSTTYGELFYYNGNWYTDRWHWNRYYDNIFYIRSRMWAEKHALTDTNGIIDSLLAQNVASDPDKRDIIEVALVSFDGTAVQQQDFTTDGEALKTKIKGLSTHSGTNWEDALTKAASYVDAIKAAQPNEQVYVIFMTDGEPTQDNHNHNTMDPSWDNAKDEARSLVDPRNCGFYALFTWGDSDRAHYLSSLVQYAYTGSGGNNTTLDPAYAKYYTNADTTETLIEALQQITHDITTSVGYTDVELEDGITTMTASTVKASAGGSVTGVKYYRSGGVNEGGTEKYDSSANNGLGELWSDAPDATINADGEVDWHLGDDFILEDAVTYTMTFVVWPKQESLNLVADLNNGIIAYNDLTPAQKAQIHVGTSGYTLKTNTDYPSVTYRTITTTQTDEGEPEVVISDPISNNITNPDPVDLAEDKLHAVKSWEDSMDDSQREEVGGSVELYLLVDGEYYFKDPATGVRLGVTLTEESDWTETNYVAIAPGLMVTEDSPAYDPSAPHFEWDGVTYAMLETGHEYVFEEKENNYHFELTAYTHHPMIMGSDNEGNPIIKDVVFTKDGDTLTGIESVTNMGDSISATNTLKGGINIEKKVVDSAGNDFDVDDTFTVTIHITDAEGNALPSKSLEGVPAFNYDYRIYYGPKNPHYNDDPKHRSGHIYGTGTSFDETLYVGDTIRVVNVETGALFYVEEDLEDSYNYELDSIDYMIRYGDEEDAAEYSDEDKVVKGETTWYSVKGNSASYVTVTNKVPDAFYIYHSSDNTIERIAMDDSRVRGDGTFNIVAETKSGNIYGGYYTENVLAGMTEDQIRAAAYSTRGVAYTYAEDRDSGLWTTDSEGAPYVGDMSTWVKTKAYSTVGTAMTPVKDKVYYLKEVPDVFLQPATYVVYDTIDVDDAGFCQIKKLYLMTATDDKTYKSVGFDVTTSTAITENRTGAYTAEFWGNQVLVTKGENTYEVLTVANLISGHSVGQIAYKTATAYLVPNANYKEVPYHITPDNIKVTSLKQMAVFIKNTRFKDWTKPGMYKATLAKKGAYAVSDE